MRPLAAVFLTNLVVCGQVSLGFVALASQGWPAWSLPFLIALSYPVTVLSSGIHSRIAFCLGNGLLAFCHYEHAGRASALVACVIGLGVLRGAGPRIVGQANSAKSYVAATNVAYIVGPLLGELVRAKPLIHFLVGPLLLAAVGLAGWPRAETVEFVRKETATVVPRQLYPAIAMFYTLQGFVVTYFAQLAEAKRDILFMGLHLGSGHWAALHGLLVAILVFPLSGLRLLQSFIIAAVSFLPGCFGLACHASLFTQVAIFSVAEAGLSANLLAYSVTERGSKIFWLLAGIGYLAGTCALAAGDRWLPILAVVGCVLAGLVGRRR